ncbi:MAG TPA: hypothetical protein VFG87_05290 [Amycolatopsis sp.]|jgi:hypothetical protein|nr:hypothetical protein [Amycolatopsis sp.]
MAVRVVTERAMPGTLARGPADPVAAYGAQPADTFIPVRGGAVPVAR